MKIRNIKARWWTIKHQHILDGHHRILIFIIFYVLCSPKYESIELKRVLEFLSHGCMRSLRFQNCGNIKVLERDREKKVSNLSFGIM